MEDIEQLVQGNPVSGSSISLPEMSGLEKEIVLPLVQHDLALDGPLTPAEGENAEQVYEALFKSSVESYRRSLRSGPDLERFDERCLNRILSAIDYHTAQTAYRGAHQRFLPDGMKAYLAPSERLALDYAFEILKERGEIKIWKPKGRTETYGVEDLVKVPEEKAVSLMVSSTHSTRPKIMNRVMKAQSYRPERGSLIRRVRMMNLIQKLALHKSITYPRILSVQEGNLGGFDDPGRHYDATGANPRAYTTRYISILRTS